ncbi:LysR family transcriptional regulator [Agrococcus sp. Ld7]|uniref:LysR family transcriptional regulator n=1 Tax=Agrococcus sp. Ld7 TaxID=649148 RepID=UPI003869DD1F
MPGPHVPELAALEVLVAVSELGSLGRVAARLGVSQQAVSARVRAIEAQVGAPLVTRSPRGSTLTATGAIIASWASDVLAAAERLEAGIESVRAEAARQLDIAASLTIAEYLLPRWLVSLRDLQESTGHPLTRVGLTAANSEAVLGAVRSRAVTLGFVETPEIPADLRHVALGTDRMHVAVAPAHPWARRSRPVSAAELAATPLVAREEGSGTRRALEHLLLGAAGSALAPPRVVLSSTAAVRAAIAAGVAPGVLSSLAIADDLALGRLVTVEVADVVLTRTLAAVWASGEHPPTVPAQDLVAIARRWRTE